MPITIDENLEADVEDVLPAWYTFHGVRVRNVAVRIIDENIGKGIVALVDLKGPDEPIKDSRYGQNVMLRVPEDVVLTLAHIDEYAKVEPKFRNLLAAYGTTSPREKFTLYLTLLFINTLTPLSILPTPWSTYVEFLPETLSTPTLWPSNYLPLLSGTELAPALTAKLHVLSLEFTRFVDAWESRDSEDALRHVPFSSIDGHGVIGPGIWMLADAWYRSRVLEVPGLGAVMVPVLDMANHSADAQAFWDRDSETGDVVMALRAGAELNRGDEVFINYGTDRGAAEFLFTYGMFEMEEAVRPLVIPVEGGPLDHDPLAKAKRRVFGERPVARIAFPADLETWEDGTGWECPFGYLAVLNAEDGLAFKIARTVEGYEELRMFVDDEDVTERAKEGEKLLEGNPIAPIIKFRVLELVKELLATNLERIAENFDVSTHEELWEGKDYEYSLASQFAYTESHLLQTALDHLEDLTLELYEDEVVKNYVIFLQDGEEISPKDVVSMVARGEWEEEEEEEEGEEEEDSGSVERTGEDGEVDFS